MSKKKIKNPADKNFVTITVDLPKDLAESFSNFKETFKPKSFKGPNGESIPFPENDFWIELLLLGAESLQEKLRQFVNFEKQKQLEQAASESNDTVPERLSEDSQGTT